MASKPVRSIKKYPNRRLYDTVESRYITLADIRQHVMNNQPLEVYDKKTSTDITVPILLDVLKEQQVEEKDPEKRLTVGQVCRLIKGQPL
jgi:polyhydroxyalkanoate synthesis repressor PhaR